MLSLPAELTQAQARVLTEQLQAQLRLVDAAVVEVDASALSRFDSSALAVLLQLRRDALALGKSFGVRGLPVQFRGLAGLYGVAELLQEANS
jgi:phospholipid transport system transporter-binding protein